MPPKKAKSELPKLQDVVRIYHAIFEMESVALTLDAAHGKVARDC